MITPRSGVTSTMPWNVVWTLLGGATIYGSWHLYQMWNTPAPPESQEEDPADSPEHPPAENPRRSQGLPRSTSRSKRSSRSTPIEPVEDKRLEQKYLEQRFEEFCEEEQRPDNSKTEQVLEKPEPNRKSVVRFPVEEVIAPGPKPAVLKRGESQTNRVSQSERTKPRKKKPADWNTILSQKVVTKPSRRPSLPAGFLSGSKNDENYRRPVNKPPKARSPPGKAYSWKDIPEQGTEDEKEAKEKLEISDPETGGPNFFQKLIGLTATAVSAGASSAKKVYNHPVAGQVASGGACLLKEGGSWCWENLKDLTSNGYDVLTEMTKASAVRPKRLPGGSASQFTEEQLERNPFAGMPVDMRGGFKSKDRVRVNSGGFGFNANGNETDGHDHITGHVPPCYEPIFTDPNSKEARAYRARLKKNGGRMPG